MTKRLALALLLSLGIVGAACAQAIPVASRDVKAAASGSYKLDNSHANVVFKVSHLGYSGYIGRFNKISGTLEFDAAAPEKSGVSVTIDVASVDTNNAKLEEELRGADYFNANRWPNITFTSTSIQKTGEHTGTITGDLTFMGVTKPVTLAANFNGAGKNPFSNVPMIGFSATTSFKRSDFGMTKLVPAVSDEVSLIIEAEFQKN